MTPPEPGSTEALLADGAWLRGLARRLASDAASAEDAVQEALAAAVAHPPEAGPRRGWLATVLRNALRQEHRGAQRRRAHELAAAPRRESAPSAASVAARLEASRRLLAAVHALEEPHRTTIVLRFLDDLPPREVARRMDCSVKTVHGRVERGLQRLRARLDRETQGGRQAWLSALTPVAWPDAAATLAGTGTIVMGMNGKLVAGIRVAALAALAFVRLAPLAVKGERETLGDPGTVELVGPTTLTSKPAQEPAAVDRAPVERTATEATESVPAVAARPETFAGRVLDVERRPVRGVAVKFRPTSGKFGRSNTADGTNALVDEEPAISDANGGFRMRLPGERGELVATSPDWASVVRPGVHDEPPPAPPVVVVAPRRAYAGIAVDEAGTPVAGALVEVRLPDLDVIREFGGEFGSLTAVVSARSSSEGRFELDGVGWLAGVRVVATAPAHGSATLALPESSAEDLRVVLPRVGAGEDVLVGRVLGGLGNPVEGAHVTLGADVTEAARTDASGRFALSIPEDLAGNCTLLAVAPGRLPARRTIRPEDVARGEELVLVLDREALTIEGQVLDEGGRPLAGAQVWTFDGETFGAVVRRMGSLEVLVEADVEELLCDDPENSGRETTSDAAGRFALTGLIERTYTVFAMHPETLEVVRADHVVAGSRGLVLRAAGHEPARAVGGRVTTLSGEPLPGALVRASRTVELPDGTLRPRSAAMDFHATTDEAGRFRFDALCVAETDLLLNGTDVPVAQRRALADEDDLDAVDFSVPAACWVRIELEDPARANAFEIEDSEGERMPLVFRVGSVTLSSISATLARGRSDVVKVDERARTLVLFLDGEEAGRVPLALVPGEVTVVSP